MAAKSKLERYKQEISDLIGKGVSIRSAWKIINSGFSLESQISYNAFFHFVKKHIRGDKEWTIYLKFWRF